MDDATTTTVNIKSIRVDAWDRAKTAAGRNDETLGSWVSRACDQLAAAEASGERLYLPDKPANPAPRPPLALPELVEAALRIAAAGEVVPKSVHQLSLRAVRECYRGLLGMPPAGLKQRALRLSGPQ